MPARVGTFSGGGLGFGVAFMLEDAFSSVAEEIERKFESLGGATDRIAQKVEDSFGKIMAGVSMVYTGMELLSPIKSGLEVAAQFEVANVRLTTLLHSAEAAKQVFDSLKAEEPYMPFDLPTLLNANTALIGAGMAANKAKSSVDAVANSIAAVGGGVPEMTAAMSDLQKIYEIGYADKRHLFQLSYSAHLPILQMLQNSTGRTKEDLQSSKLTFEEIINSMQVAAAKGGMFEGALAKMAATWNGKLTTLHTRVLFALAAIGDAIMPVAHKIIDVVIEMLDKFEKFAQTTQGKVVIAVTIAALVFVSLSLILVGLMMIFQALAGVIELVMAELLPFVAIGIVIAGVIYGLYKMIDSLNGVVVALGLVLADLVFGPIGWVLGVMYLLIKAWREFTAIMEDGAAPATGFLGFLQKVGGVLQGVWEIMKNANEEGFTLTEKMAVSLDKMGMLDTVIALGTWIVRIKEFAKGMWDGMATAWRMFKGAIEWVFEALRPIGDMLDKIGIHLRNQTSDLEKWKMAGYIAGFVIVGIMLEVAFSLLAVAAAALLSVWPLLLVIGIIWLAVHAYNHWGIWGKILAGVILFTLLPVIFSLIVALWDMAVAVAAAIWPVTLVIAIIALVIWIVYELVRGIMWLYDNWNMIWWGLTMMVEAAEDAISDFFSSLWAGAKKWWDMGAAWVSNMWEGFKAHWHQFVSWLVEAIRNIPIIGQAFDVAMSVAQDIQTGYNYLFGEDPAQAGSAAGSITAPSQNPYQRISDMVVASQAAPAGTADANNPDYVNALMKNFAASQQQQPAPVIHNHFYVDSEEVATKQKNIYDLTNARD